MTEKSIYIGTVGPFIYDDTDETVDSAVRKGDATYNPAQSHILDIKNDYAAGDLDSEAEIIVAVNNIGTKINAILSALENAGILETS